MNDRKSEFVLPLQDGRSVVIPVPMSEPDFAFITKTLAALESTYVGDMEADVVLAADGLRMTGRMLAEAAEDVPQASNVRLANMTVQYREAEREYDQERAATNPTPEPDHE